jgi:hypothetical protein
LLKVLEDDRFPLLSQSEDVAICGVHKATLCEEFGIVFAETALAKRFSFERDASYVFAGARPFGFHGVFHIFLVTDPRELLSLVREFPESVACSDMTELLLRNLLKFGHCDCALALAERILEFRPDNNAGRQAVFEARSALAARKAMGKAREGVMQRLAARLRSQR